MAGSSIRDQKVLNVDAAIHRLLGDRSLYCKLLQEFLAHHRDDFALLRAAVLQRNHQECVSIVHALRGAANFIGARWLEMAAQELEQSLLDSRSADLESQLTALAAALDAVYTAAKKELDPLPK